MRFPFLSVVFLLASNTLLPAQTNLSFELSRDTYMAFGVEAMAQGDFNGDGKPDIAVVTNASLEVYVHDAAYDRLFADGFQ